MSEIKMRMSMEAFFVNVGNYRSSLKDASDALKINGKHMKAILRGII